ncbi:hypothetical protein [Gordonibacter sp. An230]|uniref:hypothetical protein n=1 Tax=Gordonibacter sp. An230 TaxID=1965592 RepID=UPI00111E4955|nr:hypothetical protein [Gordonibacter sp. An230]
MSFDSDHQNDSFVSFKPQERDDGKQALVKKAAPAVGALLVGGLLGFFLASSFGCGALGVGSADAVASFSYDGIKEDVLLDDVVSSRYGTYLTQGDDGEQEMPTMGVLSSYVTDLVLVHEAKAEGVQEPTDEQLNAFCQTAYGTADWDRIAQSYAGADASAEDVRQWAVDSYMIKELRKKVTGKEGYPSSVSAPIPPAEGVSAMDAVDESYSSYVIALMGDEWDAASNTWARQDGEFFQALGGESFDPNNVSYGQALTAYNLAVQKLDSNAAGDDGTWSAYVKDLQSRINICFSGFSV